MNNGPAFSDEGSRTLVVQARLGAPTFWRRRSRDRHDGAELGRRLCCSAGQSGRRGCRTSRRGGIVRVNDGTVDRGGNFFPAYGGDRASAKGRKRVGAAVTAVGDYTRRARWPNGAQHVQRPQGGVHVVPPGARVHGRMGSECLIIGEHAIGGELLLGVFNVYEKLVA